MSSLIESQVAAFHSARQCTADHSLASGRLLMSDQYFNGEGRVEKAIKLVKKYKTLVTRDEASYGMLSSYEISEEVTGNRYSSDTNQSFYKNIKKLWEAGAKTFGITATPNREMKEAIGIDWNIINPLIGLPVKTLPKINACGSPDYKPHYDNEMIEYIANNHADDVLIGGYSFE